jgi:hypothetical protein
LQKAAEDPDNPIEFDERTKGYLYTYADYQGGDKATLIIYHCPFCGGVAPQSKRKLQFAAISHEEHDRLADLLGPITTIDQALAKLGKPDLDDYSTTKYPEIGDQPPTTVFHRVIRYYNLSKVAEVVIHERRNGSIWWSLQGKCLKQPGE